MPHVCSPPGTIDFHLRPPATLVGVGVQAVTVPMPSWPRPLAPQHQPSPAESMPQVVSSPASMRVKVMLPAAWLGTTECPVADPLPKAPALLVPQQYALPAVSSSHE